MKKLFALALVVLGLAACQTEPNELDVNVGGEVLTTVNISIPETDTRSNSALGAFENVDLTGDLTIRYILQVYYKGEPSKERLVKYSDGKSVVFDVRLVSGRDYQFVAWADLVEGNAFQENVWSNNDGIHYNTEDLANITLKDTWVAMDETRDAFTVSEPVNNYSGASVINLTLKRPFAKLRVKTTDMEALNNIGIMPTKATVEYRVDHYNAFNAFAGTVIGDSKNRNIKHENFKIGSYGEDVKNGADMTLFTDYFFAADQEEVVNFNLSVYDQDNAIIGEIINFNTPIPARRNYLTTIAGNILTDRNNVEVKIHEAFDGAYDYEDDDVTTTVNVNTAEDLAAAFGDNSDVDVVVLTGDINLEDLLSRAAYTALTIKNGKTLTIDLGGNKLTATTYENSGNQEIFLVKGTFNVKNGTIEYEHKGENMGWGSMTTIFDVTAGGVLNLEGVTAKNLGGSDMGFVAHLNNWGEVTLNVDKCTLESNYVPVRVFNSGNDKNNVTIKNSTLKGVSAAFWVHNYTVADFGSEAKAESQKALLNFEIYNQGNTFSPDVNGLRYGFTNSIRTDAYGITKVVSEDGTEVTLGSIVENGLIRRGVAGAEENTTITKVVVEEGVGVLYDRTFRRFYALETVELPSTLTTIGAAGSGVFQSCTALKNIVIPESVTVLGKGSFQECSSLESINIPAGVTRIEADALRATGLVSVEFHEGVTYFGAQAFRDCKQLKEVVIKAPEFTMEGNTFGITAAPFTPMTIYVANAEMKTYVESKLTAHAKTYITVVAPEVVASTDALKAALTTDAKMVSVAKGEYTFPASSVKAGQTIICEEGTVFTGTSGLNINGATVIGAEFKNENGVAVSGTINGTFKICTFTGHAALRWCYSVAGNTTVFENCVIKTDFRGFHYDDMNGDVIFRNCEINGFNAYSGDGTVTFEGCTFGCDESRYNGLNIYSNTKLVNCTFNYVSGKTNFIDMEGTDKTLTITNCTATLDGATANVADFVGGSKLADNTVVYN